MCDVIALNAVYRRVRVLSERRVTMLASGIRVREGLARLKGRTRTD